jgi:hypothetical protein
VPDVDALALADSVGTWRAGVKVAVGDGDCGGGRGEGEGGLDALLVMLSATAS